jgi:hypothetical protein
MSKEVSITLKSSDEITVEGNMKWRRIHINGEPFGPKFTGKCKRCFIRKAEIVAEYLERLTK